MIRSVRKPLLCKRIVVPHDRPSCAHVERQHFARDHLELNPVRVVRSNDSVNVRRFYSQKTASLENAFGFCVRLVQSCQELLKETAVRIS